MKNKTASFTPILQKLPAQDTVAVAHWCDDGTLGVDLLPTTDRGSPSLSLETVLSAPMVRPTTEPGMNALHDAVIRVRDTSQQVAPGALPVLIFLYGDHGGMYNDQANDMLDQPLGPLPLVYGINNGVVPVQQLQFHSQNWLYIVHYLSDRTGGVVLSTWRDKYADELDRILAELQGRYQLGFVPTTLDGKKHELQVRLSDDARHKLKSVDLRYPSSYLASSNALRSPPSPRSQAEAALSLAISSNSPYQDIVFDASGKTPAVDQATQFHLYIDPRSLTWKPLDNGDRETTLNLALAVLSQQGVVLTQLVKQFEALQSKGDQASASPKAVIVPVTFALPTAAARVRFVLQDSLSGHLGSFDLPVSRIHVPFTPSAAHP